MFFRSKNSRSSALPYRSQYSFGRPRKIRKQNFSKSSGGLLGNQVSSTPSSKSFAFQILGVLSLTVAVFLAAQGIFGATGTAQIKTATTELKLLTNFESAPDPASKSTLEEISAGSVSNSSVPQVEAPFKNVSATTVQTSSRNPL